MIIRPANLEIDALAITEGAKDFASRTIVRLPKDFTSIVSRIIDLPGVEILIVENRGKVVGGIGILYVPYVWNPEILVGEKLFIWAAKDAPFRAATILIDYAIEHIIEKGAEPMFRGSKGMGKICMRHGLMPAETLFMREFNVH